MRGNAPRAKDALSDPVNSGEFHCIAIRERLKPHSKPGHRSKAIQHHDDGIRYAAGYPDTEKG